ncbi:hypothetical protein FIU93_17835 [Labrenzia sp. THAF35]|nr:hypothetical protein FIU93_17835 [Labrenzia sp. THAF35]
MQQRTFPHEWNVTPKQGERLLIGSLHKRELAERSTELERPFMAKALLRHLFKLR